MNKLVIVSLISLLLFGCSDNKEDSSILTKSSIRETLSKSIAQQRAYNSTNVYVTIPGTIAIIEIRFSDTKDKILFAGSYRDVDHYSELSCVLKRNEFGIYNGTLSLPGDLKMPLEVKDPENLVTQNN